MSNFKLISRPLGTVQCFVLQRDDGAEFEILSGYGAGLNAWRLPDNNGKLQDLLFGYREGDDIFKMGPDTNAGCRLAPFPGRVAYAKFNWNGSDYQLVNNVSWAPHDSEKCVATFGIDWPGAFTGFPFPFRAVNKITFTGESYTVESTVTNIGKCDLPYSEGWHPYYTLGEKINGLQMTLPESNLAILDKADIPTGEFKPDTRFVSGRLINDEFINDCFCLNQGDGTFVLKNKKNFENILATVELKSDTKSLQIWQKAGDEQYNAIQIYTPPDRMSIAIEPMTAEPDTLNHHRDKPGESRTFTFGAKFQKR